MPRIALYLLLSAAVTVALAMTVGAIAGQRPIAWQWIMAVTAGISLAVVIRLTIQWHSRWRDGSLRGYALW